MTRLTARLRSDLTIRLVGLVVGAVFTALAIRQVDLGQTLAAAAAANPGYLAGAAALALVNVPVRALRWRLLIASDLPCSFWPVCRALVLGQFANVTLPLRIGDLTRIVALSYDVRGSKVTLAGTVVVERWLDLAVLGGSLLALLPLLVLPGWFKWWEAIAVAIVGLGILPAMILARWRRLLLWPLRRLPAPDALRARFVAGLDRFLAGFQALADLRALGPLWGLSLLTWALSVAAASLIGLALGLTAPVAASAFAFLVLTLGASIPAPPLRIGVFEYLCVLALAEFGVPAGPALSYGLLLHAIAFGWPILLGGILLAWPGSRPKLASPAQARETP